MMCYLVIWRPKVHSNNITREKRNRPKTYHHYKGNVAIKPKKVKCESSVSDFFNVFYTVEQNTNTTRPIQSVFDTNYIPRKTSTTQ